jgi:tetratricopeptide (TPR) repeat protein
MGTLTRRAARESWESYAVHLSALVATPPVPLTGTQLVHGWQALEAVLRVLVTHPDARGQELVAVARQFGALTLDETHALLDAQAVATRAATQVDAAPSAADQELIRGAAHIVARAIADTALTPPPLQTAGAAPSVAASPPPLPPPIPDLRPPAPAPAASPRSADAWSPPAQAPAPADPLAGVLLTPPVVTPPTGGGRSALLVVGGLALLIVGAAAGALFMRSRGAPATAASGAGDSPALRDCRTAFESGDGAGASRACDAAAQLARTRPDHAIALVYLARLKRSAGDVQGAIADADLAQRLLPRNGIALRELGAAFLDAGNPGEARRAFVSAVQGDPSDQVAMAGLACALHRLGRVDEAQRWRGRTTRTAFDACLNTPSRR